ncbi:hypothetical protein LTR86_009075 [Recurvomyces mirabilis]|nr:hypothetical protein LTR86_009075 [Recurvomyces mirabilis]
MPHISRQERYETLRLPGNAYNVLDPHPKAQTVYSYPLSTAIITLIFLLSALPGLTYALVTPSSREPNIVTLVLLMMESMIFAIVHPDVGTLTRRTVETPARYDLVFVHRPFLGRRKCETGYGVTGGNAYKKERFLWWEMKVRREPAIWRVVW